MRYAFLTGCFLPELSIEEYEAVLADEFKKIIDEDEDAEFYLAMKSGIDVVAQEVFGKLQAQYPRMKYTVVLPRPVPKGEENEMPFIVPDELRREELFVCTAFLTDRWIIRNSDAVICLIEKDDVTALHSMNAALKSDEKVINFIDRLYNEEK